MRNEHKSLGLCIVFISNSVCVTIVYQLEIIYIGKNGTTKAQVQGKVWWKKKLGRYVARTPSLMIAMEKLVCAFTSVFVDTPESSFTLDIERLRYT